jgi:hypothetical protein
MPHPSYWQCIDNSGKRILDEFILPTKENGDSAGSGFLQISKYGGTGFGRYEVLGYASPSIFAPLRTMLLILFDHNDKSSVLLTSYPYAAKGQRHELRISRIEEFENEAEARLHATMELAGPGMMLTFYDTQYYKNKNVTTAPMTLSYYLSGLAFLLQKTDIAPLVITAESYPGAYKTHSDVHRLQFNTEPPDRFVFELDKASGLIPRDETDICEFQGRINDVKPFEWQGIEFYQLRINVFEAEGDKDIDVFVAEKNIKDGYKPCVDDNVQGIMWLQGHL